MQIWLTFSRQNSFSFEPSWFVEHERCKSSVFTNKPVKFALAIKHAYRLFIKEVSQVHDLIDFSVMMKADCSHVIFYGWVGQMLNILLLWTQTFICKVLLILTCYLSPLKKETYTHTKHQKKRSFTCPQPPTQWEICPHFCFFIAHFNRLVNRSSQ